MTIVITGATGFLGYHVASSFRREGYNVVGMGRNAERAALIQKQGTKVFFGDISDKEFVFKAIKQATVVIHIAALSAPWGPRDLFMSANVTGTQNVVDACVYYRVERLIHISSPSVAFSGENVSHQTEQAPYPKKYLSVYSYSKRLAEDIVNNAIRKGLPATIVRPKAMFGPGDTTLLPRLLSAATSHQLFQIGDGSNLVDLTHVDNAVLALLLLLHEKRSIGRTYNVTNDEHVPLWAAINFVLKEFLGPVRLRQIPYRAAFMLAAAFEARALLLRREPALTRYTVAILGRNQTYDIKALKQDTGYKPRVALWEGLAQTVGALKEIAVSA